MTKDKEVKALAFEAISNEVEEEVLLDKSLREFERFYRFIKEIILPYERTKQHAGFAPFHLQLMYTVCKEESATASPRGVLKSQIAAKYRSLHRLVDPDREDGDDLVNILLISEGSDLCKEHVEWLKDHLENNPVLIERYGVLHDKRNLTWNEEELELTNGSRIKAKGITAALRGKHPTDIIIDDAESENNINTEETLGAIKRRFWRVIWPMRRASNTRLTVIGTIVQKGSLLDDLIRTGEFYGKKWKALYHDPEKSDREDGLCSIWPEYWPVEWLLKQKARMGTHMFNAEFQNEPVGLEDQIILEEWIRSHSAIDLAKVRPVRRYMAVDPAVTEEKWGCYSAIVVFDEAPNGQLLERLAWRGKVTGPALRDQIIATYRHMALACPVRLGIEEVAFQKVLRQSINEIEPDIQIVPIKVTKDKVTRLVGVSRYIELGTASFMTPGLKTELLEAPKCSMDRVDATVHALAMYEKDHPTLSDSTSIELDTLKHLDDASLACYLERAAEGVPLHDVPAQYAKRYREAMEIQEFMETEFM